MRFHFGISFRLKTLKKFLFPILIGVATYFGLNFLNLGFIQVNALTNLNTSFTYNYNELELLDSKIDDNITFNEFFSHLNNIESSYYKLMILVTFYTNNSLNYVNKVRLMMIPTSVASIPIEIRIGSNGSVFSYITYSSSKYYDIPIYNTNYTDIYSTTLYSDIYTCLTTDNCQNRTGSNSSSSTNFATASPSGSGNNDTSYVLSVPIYSTSTTQNYWFYYSSKVPLYYLVDVNNTSTINFYKSLYYGPQLIANGDYFITYKEYLDSLHPEPGPEPEPSPEPSPDDDTTTHKALFNKIYWFDDNTTEKGILTSIYEVLFLYCLTMIVFKLLTYLHNKRW